MMTRKVHGLYQLKKINEIHIKYSQLYLTLTAYQIKKGIIKNVFMVI